MKSNNTDNLTKININWYPGHMVKAQKEIKDNLKLIDIVVEILDARIPLSSRNPLINDLTLNKARIIVLNKADLADDNVTNAWKVYFESQNMTCIITNSSVPGDIKRIVDTIKKVGNEIYLKKNQDKKIEITPIYRVLVVGIPNVGKSTIINKIAGRNSANVGNRPGVTKKKQWIRVASNIDLLDTPGLLWPNLDNNESGLKLALTGNINLDILDVEELACEGISLLLNSSKFSRLLAQKYNLSDDILFNDSYDILESIGKRRGCLVSGGNVDMTKAANVFLEDLRSGKIGKMSFEEVN
ncbi:MAG: ribosome biogenesis GTPase YlqF [Clostridia bacterium]|nr:ribosome biogenesis GTPase YlqF [Clostridia bacterium]